MSLQTIVIAIVIAVLLVGVATWFFGGRSAEGFAHASSGAFHVVAIGGVLLAVGWAFLSQDWVPRLNIDLGAEAYPISSEKRKLALLQVSAGLKNDGKVRVDLGPAKIIVRGVNEQNTKTNEDGDVVQMEISSKTIAPSFRIMPGESDYIYYETVIACTKQPIQVFLDIKESEYPAKDSSQPLSYERKKVLMLSKACGTEKTS